MIPINWLFREKQKRKKIALLANCQGKTICDILSYIHEDFDVKYFNVSEVNESNFNKIKTFIKISDLVAWCGMTIIFANKEFSKGRNKLID